MIVKRLISWFQTLETIVFGLLAVVCVGSLLLGFQPRVVLSGSMEPSIHTGSLAYIQTGIECSEIAEGDVIAFEIGDGKAVTHRVVEHDVENRCFVTKGDANDSIDLAPVSYDRVIGKTVGSIPQLGFFLMAFKERWALWVGALAAINVLLCAIAALVARREVPKKGRHDGTS